MTVLPIDNSENPIDFFRLKSAETKSRASIGNMTRAIDSLARFIGGAKIDFDSFDDELLGEWIAYQLFNGYYTKTVAYNINKIAALYNKAVEKGIAKPNGAFSSALIALNSTSSVRFDGINHKDVFSRLQSVIRTDHSTHPQRQLAKDLLLFSIYNGGMSFENIAAYKKDDYSGNNEYILSIIARYSRPKSKYLFPLDQAHSTSRQLMRSMETLFNSILTGAGLRLSISPAYTPVNLWCAIAMTCGISAADIAACIAPLDKINALTAFVTPSTISSSRIAEIRLQVITILTANPVRWYAMHLRRHVDYATLTQRLHEKDIRLKEIYYPMEEIVHKLGSRKVFESRPVISWLLFFKDHVAGLNKLFHEIGDLAWGYRQSRDINSPYAPITPDQINRYKVAIGTFGDDTELYPEGEIKLQPGDRLVVIGGLLNGRPATFDTMAPHGDDRGRTVCRIMLDGGRYKDWIVKQDVRLIKKITEEQFNDLCKQNRALAQ